MSYRPGWCVRAGCCETYVGRAGDGLARENLAVMRREARPVRRLPDVEPYDDFRPSRWCHGGILQSSDRSEAPPATPTLPGRGARARQFPISRLERRALSVATSPALFGAGADGHPEALGRRPLGACPYRRQCAGCSPPKFIGGLSQTVMGWRIDRAINGRNRPAYPLGQRERAIRLLDGIGLMDYEGINGLT